jgi:membrane protease YdiL (CAAX protease family)
MIHRVQEGSMPSTRTEASRLQEMAYARRKNDAIRWFRIQSSVREIMSVIRHPRANALRLLPVHRESLWVGLQIVGVAVAGPDGPVTFSRSWQALGVAGWTESLVPEFFGSAPSEEVYYRGLLLAQGYLVGKRFATDRRIALEASLLVVLAWFAAVHIPARLVQRAPLPLPVDVLGTFLLGVVIALVDLRTGNLFPAVGVHALRNRHRCSSIRLSRGPSSAD